MSFWQWLLALAMVFTCFLLVVVILLQRGRGGGLAGAFGGSGGTSAFGAKTGDVFTWITVVVAGVFILLSIAATFVFDQTPQPDAPVIAAAPDAGGTTGAAAEAVQVVPTSPVPPGVNITGLDSDGIKIERVDNPFATPPGGTPADAKPAEPAAAPGTEQPKPVDGAAPTTAEKPAEQPKQPASGEQDKPNP